MNSIEFIRYALAISEHRALGLMEDMKDSPMTFPTAKGGNHPLWTVGHCTYAESRIIESVAQGKPSEYAHWADLFGPGSTPSDDASKYPSYEELLSAFKKTRAGTLAFLKTLGEADLDQPSKGCPPERQAMIGTIAKCFSVLIVHLSYHTGQIADARRVLGRKPVFF